MPFPLMQPVEDDSSFFMLDILSVIAVSVILCNVFLNIYSEGQFRLSSSCVLPKIRCHSFSGDPRTPGR